jgi:hypothetical protein
MNVYGGPGGSVGVEGIKKRIVRGEEAGSTPHMHMKTA